MKIQIRPETKKDIAKIRNVNAAAFDTKAEANIVDSLRKSSSPLISLVAESDGMIVGHILYSPVKLSGNNANLKIASLAPVAVLPERQNQGIGSALVEAGLRRCQSCGYKAVFVLGHPDYYPRFGFVPASRFGIKSEYDVPDEVFLVKELEKGALFEYRGVITYHPIFAQLD